jgi:hypothetical protein
MREIKLRAFIERSKEIEPVYSIDFKLKTVELGSQWASSGLYKFEDVIFMQYTGLKDKNGEEIYEGDFLEINGNIWEVFWDSGREPYWPNARWGLRKPEVARSKNNQTYSNLHPSAWYGSGVVVGNIFQDQEFVNITNEEWESRYFASRQDKE